MICSARRPTRETVATSVGLLLGGVPFLLALLDYRLDLLRTAVRQRYASNFFDLQASAFLDGRLDVPTGSLGIEGFVIDGKTYMYFPPFPALLRIPVQLVTHEFDGRLSLLSMALAWVVFATFATRLLWLVRGLVRPGGPLTRFEAAAAALLLALITGGTTLTFDAALPWVYHEVYMWSAALLVGCCYWMLRVAREPTRSSVVWLGLFVLTAGLTRTPGGWAMACTTAALGAFLAWRRGWRPGLEVVAAGVTPLALAITYNVVKFGHPYLFPLESQVWTQVNAHRRAALEVNGGTITGPQFFETSLINYFRPNGIRFVDYFPFITLPPSPAAAHGDAFLDQTYRTGSVTAFMPGLVLLTLVAVVALLRPLRGSSLATVRWPMFAAVGAAGGVMGYGYLANRYTSDFVPALVLGGIVGFWVLTRVMPRTRPVQAGAMVGLAALCVFGIAAQLATAASAAAQTWGGERLASYLSLQERLSGGRGSGVSALVSRSESPPSVGRADQLHIVGDCAALYHHTGDQYEPWVLVEQRDMTASVLPVFISYRPGMVRLFRQHGTEDRYVSLEFDSHLPQARLAIEDRDGNFYSPWFEVVRGRPVEITAHAVPDLSQIRLRVGDRPDYDLYLMTGEWNREWYKVPSQLMFTEDRGLTSNDHVRVTTRLGAPSSLCTRLAASSPEADEQRSARMP